MAIGSALSVGLIGLKAFIVQVQAFISPGLPYFSIIGLPDTSLSEARERVKSAMSSQWFLMATNPCDREYEPRFPTQTRLIT